MLDLYSPKQRRTSPGARAFIDAAAALLVFGFLGVALIAPEVLPAPLRFGGATAASAGETHKGDGWAYGGAAPATRAWAAALEPSLAVACKASHGRMRDGKQLMLHIAARIDASWRRPTETELADAVTAIGSEEQFLGDCLRWGYDAIAPCHKFAGALGDKPAEACMLPPVQRALFVEPWRRCASLARLPQVKVACRAIADEIQQKMAPAGL